METTTQQHDEANERADGAEDTAPIETAPSRPDDPAVLAAEAGKTSRERSSESPGQHLPSRQHNRGPPLDDELAGDLLVGKKAIRDYLKILGMPEKIDVYWLKRKGGWPIGKSGTAKSASLIASKRRLTRYAQKITAPTP